MDVDDAGCRGQVPDPGPRRQVPAPCSTPILADAGIEVVLSGVRVPRMNSIMERWIQSCRHELLDRTLIWNQAHLFHGHSASTNSSTTSIDPIADWPTPDRCTRCPNRSPSRQDHSISTSAAVIDSAASSTSTNMPPELHGRGFRHPQGRSASKNVCHGSRLLLQ